jgi:hypothetical protein
LTRLSRKPNRPLHFQSCRDDGNIGTRPPSGQSSTLIA